MPLLDIVNTIQIILAWLSVLERRLKMPDYPTENRNFFLPIQIEYDSDYYVQLQQKFLEYCEHVNEDLPVWNSFNNSQHRICWDANYIKQQVKKICDNILHAIQLYYHGDIKQAQNVISEIIRGIQQHDQNNFFISNIDCSYATRGIVPFSFLYENTTLRQRQKNTPLTFFRARTDAVRDFHDMGHVPLNMREKISTQRFSIPGIPCLYIGTSSLDVWKELGCPAYHDFNVSAIQLTSIGKERRILNLLSSMYLRNYLHFQLNYENVKKMHYERMGNLIETLYLSWPMVCATSFRIMHTTKFFHSEYIISHLIMLSLKELKLDGVAYASKQTVALSADYAMPQMVNVAIPVFDFDDDCVYGKIYDSVQFTNPVNFETYLGLTHRAAHSIHNHSYYHKVYHNTHARPDTLIEFAGQITYYENTRFCDFDNYLCHSPVHSFSES